MSKVPTRAELLAAIADPDMANPLAAEIAAVIAAYGNALNDQAQRQGAWPNPLVLPAPRTEVEAFGLELFTSEISALGLRVKLQGDS